jgi:hypothetical protein
MRLVWKPWPEAVPEAARAGASLPTSPGCWPKLAALAVKTVAARLEARALPIEEEPAPEQ